MDTLIRTPCAGAVLSAMLFDRTFVQDEHEGFWSICAGFPGPIFPVQRTVEGVGFVAAIFHWGYGYIKIAAEGEIIALPRGQILVARTFRQGVRWEFANPPV